MTKPLNKLSRFILHMGFILAILMLLYVLAAPFLESDALRRAALPTMFQKFIELPVAVLTECIISSALIEAYHKKQK